MTITIGTQAKGRLVGRRFDQPVPAGLREEIPRAAGGVVAPQGDVHKIAMASLQSKLSKDPGIRYGDTNYYLPTVAEIKFILEASQSDRRTWTVERFDCDDFAYVLKGEMSIHSYDAGDIRYGLCVGMVWGNFDWITGYHATNWFIANDGRLRFIEPQTDIIHECRNCKGNIGLLLV